MVWESENGSLQIAQNETGPRTFGVSVSPMECVPRPSPMHAGSSAAMACGSMGEKPTYVSINKETDIFSPDWLGHAIQGLEHLQTQQEQFKKVISYRAYCLLNMWETLIFDEITEISKLGTSLQSSFP